MKNRISVLHVAIVIIVLSLFPSCARNKTADVSSAGDSVMPVPCVIVLKTNELKSEEGMERIDADDLAGGADYIDSILPAEIRALRNVDVIDVDQVDPRMKDVSGGTLGALKEIAAKAHCENVLVINLRQFKQREGSSLASESPASAAFELRLVNAQEGVTLCNANFSETQTALSENLLGFAKAKNRGFKWITVEELVLQGMREKLRECRYLQ